MTMVYPVTREPIGRVLTGEEYDALPPNSLRELVDGVVRIMATPTRRHQDAGDGLTHALRRVGSPRVELEPELTIHTFRLGDLGYVETGVWKVPDTVAAPGLPWAHRSSRPGYLGAGRNLVDGHGPGALTYEDRR